MHRAKSIYLGIAEEIAEEIKNGHFNPGERLYSQRELCDKFSISGKTAVRVQDTLAQNGLVRKVRGSGVFVNYIKEVDTGSTQESNPSLERVVFFTQLNDSWDEKFQLGIQRRVAQLNLDFRIEYINNNNVAPEVFSVYPARSNEGYIIVSTGANIHFATGALLFSNFVRTVLIDFIIPGSPCVITDNFDGINQLVEHAVSCGHRKFLFASNYSSSLGAFNSNERELAFKQEMKYRGLHGSVIDSGNYDDIINMLKSKDAPTAIIFPQDEAALRGKRRLQEANLKNMPFIMGFDDFVSGKKDLENLTTIRVDSLSMGAAAVDILPGCGNNRRFDKIVRVPGTLIVRN